MKIVFALCLLIAIAFVIFVCSAIFVNYGLISAQGQREGFITKFSYKGIIWKTWEGEIVMGGVQQTASGTVANTWNFSIEKTRQDLIDKIKTAMDSGKPVTLKYNQERAVAYWRAGTNYIITDIKIR